MLFNLGRNFSFGAMVGLAAMAATTVAARAQAIVLQSTVDKYKAGSTLAKAGSVSIPDGGKVVVVLPSGQTRTINGPFAGKVSDLSKGGGRSNAALFNAVKQFLKTGGATTSKVGAIRGVAKRKGSDDKGAALAPLPFSWTQVPLSSRGDLCLQKDGAISIVRDSVTDPLTVTIVDLVSTQRAKVTFGAGERAVSWPADIAVKNGTFALLAPGRRMQQIRVRLISPLPDAAQTLKVLHGQRCSLQFDAFLRGFAVASDQN